MARGWAPALSVAAALACGAEDRRGFPDGVVWNVRITRGDEHPNYVCEGTVDTAGGGAAFQCSAERLSDWSVSGSVEQFRVAQTLRLWVRETGSPRFQPDIAIDLEQKGDRVLGWATVVLPDGTGSGHFGAVAEAWLNPQ